MNRGINQNIKRYFWDIDFNTLDFEKNSEYIIARILEYGDPESTDWLFSFYDKDVILGVLKKSRQLSPKSANYWALIFDVPKEEIKCLNKQFRETRSRVWPY